MKIKIVMSQDEYTAVKAADNLFGIMPRTGK